MEKGVGTKDQYLNTEAGMWFLKWKWDKKRYTERDGERDGHSCLSTFFWWKASFQCDCERGIREKWMV